uniref:CRC domain-containing protein n=1 Tax=Strigamia maritima TaxID=126957 RepID=T1IXQ6_STRMM
MMSTHPLKLDSTNVEPLTEANEIGVSVAALSANGNQQELEALENIQAELERLTDVVPVSNSCDETTTIEGATVDVKTEIVNEETVVTTTNVIETNEPNKPKPPVAVLSPSTAGTKENVPIKILQIPNNLLNSDKLVLPESVLADISKMQGPVYLVPTTSIANLTFSSGSTTQTATTTSSNIDTKFVTKRPSVPGGVVTKVIITSSPNQPGTQQVCLTTVPSTVTPTMSNTINIGGQQMRIVATSAGMQQSGMVVGSPGKVITINQALLGSPNKSQIVAIPGTPPKQGIVLGKLPITPNAKGTPTKIMIPMNMMKSPQKIAPSPFGTVNTISVLTTGTTTSTTTAKPFTMSPSKVIIRQAMPGTLKPGQTTTLIGQPGVASATSVKQVAVPISSAGNLQPVQVPGSKFHYVRLVTSSGNTVTKSATVVPITAAKTIAPVTGTMSIQAQPTATTMKIALPHTTGQQTKVIPKVSAGQQRILIPATSVSGVSQIRPTGNVTLPANALGALPPGTTLISTGSNIVMVPAQYVTQLQQQLGSQSATSSQQQITVTATTNASTSQPILPAQATTANLSSISTSSANVEQLQSSQSSKHHVNGSGLEANGVRPRKPCNCTKSQCLKLCVLLNDEEYCDCFANGEFCNNCNCNNCYNNLDHEEERQKAIRACLDRNPLAFHPKIGKGKDGENERRHNKGCNCKRSGCLKNYCECYEAKIMCSSMCKCVGCKNFEESAERKTLMHLADAAEVRVLQQTAAKNKLSSQVQDIPSKMATNNGERLPFLFVTPDVIQLTCQCLLAQAEECEKGELDDVNIERKVLEEFGRCLIAIINCANRTKHRPDRSRNNS